MWDYAMMPAGLVVVILIVVAIGWLLGRPKSK